jgi:hypothetical protein
MFKLVLKFQDGNKLVFTSTDYEVMCHRYEIFQDIEGLSEIIIYNTKNEVVASKTGRLVSVAC